VPVGKGYCLREGNGDTAILSFGPIGTEAEKAIEKSGADVAHYDMVFCKPLDVDLLTEVFGRFSRIITVEDGVRDGGFGSAVLEEASRQGYTGKIIRLGIPDEFVEQGTCRELYELCGIDAGSIARIIADTQQK
jgi:1-deoxy-D-xylulose-5-phosphate synthase